MYYLGNLQLKTYTHKQTKKQNKTFQLKITFET